MPKPKPSAPAKKPPPTGRVKVRTARPVEQTWPDESRPRNAWWFDAEATVIAQIDHDGVPEGVTRSNHHILASPNQGVSLRYLSLSIWALVLALSLYSARDLRAAVLHDEALAGKAWVVAAVDQLHTLASRVGLAGLRAAIDSAFAPMKQKQPVLDTRLALQAPPPPPEATARREEATARVLLVGASSMQFYLGSELERRLESYRGVVTYRFGKLGTGLARPDTFDWFKTLPGLLRDFKPTIVIGQFGGNDGQHLEQPGGGLILFGTEAWEQEYAERLRHVASLVQSAGARLVMLGMPITRHKKHSEKLYVVNRVTQTVTEAAGGLYLSTWDIAVDPQGESRSTMTYEGKTGPMYLPDGVHYARVGAAYVAERLCWRLERLFELVPEDELLAVATHYELASVVRQTQTHYLAFVPQQALRTDQKLPVLYLLHAEAGQWTDFSERAHGLLQTLATKHELVIVTPDGSEHSYQASPLVESELRQTSLLTEVMPDVERRLPVLSRSGIAGLSLGGNEAIVLALKNEGRFASVSSMSGTLNLVDTPARPAPNEQAPRVRRARILDSSALELARVRPLQARAMNLLLTVGASDPWAKGTLELDALLTSFKAPHELRQSPGGHDWDHWLEVLPAHVAWHAALLHGSVEARREVGSAKSGVVQAVDSPR
jgi:predicted esterase